jgi:Glutathione S-transferase, C-terminal domain
MQRAKFKLYHDAALRSARVKWLLHELVGDDFDVEYVDTYKGEQYKRKFATEMEPQLRGRLERAPFICGDRFSAADCIIAHCVMWARMYELCLGEAFDRYLGRLTERSAYRSAFSDADRFVREVPKDSPVVAMFTG